MESKYSSLLKDSTTEPYYESPDSR